MTLNIIDVFITIIIIHLIFFSIFLFIQRKGMRLSHRILGLFFLTLAINLLNALCFRKFDFTLKYCPHLFYIGSPFAYLYAPVFFFYVKSLTGKKITFKKSDFIHLLPFLIFFIYLLIRFHIHSTALKRNLIATFQVINPDLWKILTALLQIQILIYAVLIIRVTKNYSMLIKNIYSSIEKKNYSWLKFFILMITYLWLTDVSRFILGLYSQKMRIIIEAVLFSNFLFICYWIIYKAISQPEVFKGVEIEPQRKPSLSKTLSNRYLKKLKSCMDKEKPYLVSDLTLDDLAEKAAIPPRSLSEVINNNIGQNFYDFINYYRIKESQILLANPSSELKTILAILYEVGFNSKSSFHKAFNRHTGITPSKYKKLIHC
jgi:AraC-like DNA-binding protein